MPDAGEDAVPDEHLPQVGGEAGGQPAGEDAKAGQGEKNAGAPLVQQDAEEGGGNGADESGQGKYGRGVGGAASEGVFEGVEIDGFAVFGAALDGEVAEGEDENHPSVVEAAARSSEHQMATGRRRVPLMIHD